MAKNSTRNHSKFSKCRSSHGSEIKSKFGPENTGKIAPQMRPGTTKKQQKRTARKTGKKKVKTGDAGHAGPGRNFEKGRGGSSYIPRGVLPCGAAGRAKTSGTLHVCQGTVADFFNRPSKNRFLIASRH